jgi:biotin carboxyl carrier protein
VVEPGQRVAVVEAMKMEHTVRAAQGGTVSEVLVKPGESVRLDQPLAVIAATGAGE